MLFIGNTSLAWDLEQRNYKDTLSAPIIFNWFLNPIQDGAPLPVLPL